MNLRCSERMICWIMVPVKSLFDPMDATEIVFYFPQALILPIVLNPQSTSCGTSHC